MADSTPWEARFDGLGREVVRTRIERAPKPLSGLARLDMAEACATLDKALESVFVATSQVVGLIEELVAIARAHSRMYYPSSHAFLDGVYAKDGEVPLPESVYPLCITGPAGIGKTELAKALPRVLGEMTWVRVDERHPRFPMLPVVVLKIVDHMSVPKALKPITRLGLFRAEATAPRSTRRNTSAKTTPRRVRTDVEPSIENARGVAFQAGLSFLIADELQFATRSANANARVTTLISSLSRVGVPFGYIANYSLGHRLRRRNQEETQRIVDRPRFLLPESIDSADWQATVDAHIDVAPDIFKFDRVEAAHLLHRCTAAIPRLLRKLLVLTYDLARRDARYTVDLEDVLTAYNSVEFSVQRADVLLMQRQNASGLIADPKRMDLWCPFELPPPVVERARQDEERDREERIRHQFLLSSLTKNERDGYELLGKLPNKKAGSNVVPFRRNGLSVEALLAAERLVRRKGSKP